MYRPLVLHVLDAKQTPPSGVRFTGVSAEGCYVVVRLSDSENYIDRFFNQEGKEVMKVIGLVVADAFPQAETSKSGWQSWF